jgi:uncharacterized protein
VPMIGILAIASGLATQVVKVILASFRSRRPDFSLLLTTGGMPSSHTATVTTLALLIGERAGWGGALFSVTLVFAFYVVFEATGLRQEVGKQAAFLNYLVDGLIATHTFDRRRLRELTGHTWAEVAGGLVCGVGGWLVGRRFLA